MVNTVSNANQEVGNPFVCGGGGIAGTIAGIAVLFALTAGAVDYHFKGTVDDCLDNGANWDPAITDFSTLSATADKLFINDADSTRKTLTLSADFAPSVKDWEVSTYDFALGAGRTLTFPGSTEAFYVTGGTMFRLTSGMFHSPNQPLVIGRWSPNCAKIEVTGNASVLRSKGVKLNGDGHPEWGAASVPGFRATTGAVVDGLGGAFDVLGPYATIEVRDSVLTNFSAFTVCKNQGYYTRNNTWIFSNSVVQTTSTFLDNGSNAFSNNLIRFCGGTKFTSPYVCQSYGVSNRFEFVGAGTEISHTHNSYNGFARFGGRANRIDVSDGAVFRTTGSSFLYSSVSVGYDSDWNGGGHDIDFRVTSGGRLLVPNACIYIGEGTKVDGNRLLVTGAGSLAVAGTGFAIGGSYNNGVKNTYATCYSNVLEIADGGIVSNLAKTVELPRQGWGNRTRVDGGTLYAAAGIQIGSGSSNWAATNNLVEITGGGLIEGVGSFTVYGASNVVRVTDGTLKLGGSLMFYESTEGGRIEIGTNGVIKASTVEMREIPGAKLRIDLPPTGPVATPIQGNFNLKPRNGLEIGGLRKLLPGDYTLAETAPGGYMFIGTNNSDSNLAEINEALARERTGTKLKKIGNCWTTGKTVKLVLHVAPVATVMYLR